MRQKVPKLFQQVPTPQEVRDKLGDALREAKILRQLLKVSEQVARERQNRQVEVQHVG